MMKRSVLDEAHVHPAARDVVARQHHDTVLQVQQALATHAVVVVGMRQNPFPKRARKALQAAGIDHHYLEYGSYFSEWRRRNALKMWTGWPTFPMVFAKGVLLGGADELKRLIDSGDMQQLIS